MDQNEKLAESELTEAELNEAAGGGNASAILGAIKRVTGTSIGANTKAKNVIRAVEGPVEEDEPDPVLDGAADTTLYNI